MMPWPTALEATIAVPTSVAAYFRVGRRVDHEPREGRKNATSTGKIPKDTHSSSSLRSCSFVIRFVPVRAARR